MGATGAAGAAVSSVVSPATTVTGVDPALGDADECVVDDVTADDSWEVDPAADVRKSARDALFARRIDKMPFESYGSVEQHAELAVRLGGAGYDAATGRDIVTPQPRAAKSSQRPLATATIETVDVVRVRDALEPGRDADLLRAIEPVCSVDKFKEDVLGPAYVPSTKRFLNATNSRVKELRQKGYLQRALFVMWAFACSLFWVPKSDDVHDRTIFNGVPMNKVMNRPPPTPFTPIHVMLEELTAPEVAGYAAYDFATWFIQLQLPVMIANTFVVKLRNGSFWRLTGIPMGWSWAPAVAQSIALALVRLAIRTMPEELRATVVCAHVFIDNVVFAVRDTSLLPAVDAHWRAVCARFGAVIKESDTVIGPNIDWLGVQLTAGSRSCMLRERFMQKLRDLEPEVRESMKKESSPMTVRAWWRLIALAVHSRWIRQEGLSSMIQPLRWLQRVATEMHAGRIGWSTLTRPWSGVPEALLQAYHDAVVPFKLWAPPTRTLVVGESDAATTGYRAFVYVDVESRRVRARRVGPVAGHHINVEEFMAATTGIVDAMAGRRDGVIRWATDNTAAKGWMSRHWSSTWEINAAIERMRVDQRKRETRVICDHVEGTKCIPDILTRCSKNPEVPCKAAPRAQWEAVLPECECKEEMCEHVRQWVRLCAQELCAKC